jgi:hypothetical protein
MRAFPYSFEEWNKINEDLIFNLDRVAFKGEFACQFQEQQVKIMANQADWMTLGGVRVPVANATIFFSEIGDELCRRHPEAPFAAYYLDRKDGKRQWGLRSRKEGVDCSAVAKLYGGGGHPQAAGFTTQRPKLLEEKDCE